MLEYNKHKNNKEKGYYTHEEKEVISSHLYIAHKKEENVQKKLDRCDVFIIPSSIALRQFIPHFYSGRLGLLWITNQYEEHKRKAQEVKEEQETKRQEKLKEEFYRLVKQWRKETGGYSTMIHITGNDNYLDIIGMGKDVVPLLLKELEKEADYWFVALKHTAKPDSDPVPDDHYGDIEKMREDWLKWGRERKLI